jgi:hypothetical protein
MQFDKAIEKLVADQQPAVDLGLLAWTSGSAGGRRSKKI